MKHFAHVSRRSLMVAAAALLVLATVGIAPWRLVRASAQAPETAPEADEVVVGQQTDRAALQHLIDALEDTNPDVRSRSARTLEDMAQDRNVSTASLTACLPALTKAVGDEDVEVRWRAALALTRIAGARVAPPGDAQAPAIPVLVEALADGDVQIRWEAAQAIDAAAWAGGDEATFAPAVAPLIAMMNERGAETRGTFPVHPGLVSRGGWAPTDQKACGVAAHALAHVAWRVGGLEPFAPAIPGVIELLNDDEQNTRCYAAYALSQFGARAEDKGVLGPAVEPLLDMLNGQTQATPLYAALALRSIAGRLENPVVLKPAIPRLTEMLSGEHARSAVRAVGAIARTRALDQTDLQPVLPEVIELFGAPDTSTATAAMEAFGDLAGYIADEETRVLAAQTLLVVMREDNYSAVLVALRSLAPKMRDASVLRPVLSRLRATLAEDEDRPNRANAQRLLATLATGLEDQQVVEVAVSSFTDELKTQETYRWAAIDGLREVRRVVEDHGLLTPAVQPLAAVVEDLPDERPADLVDTGWGVPKSPAEIDARTALLALAEIAPSVDDDEVLAAAAPSVLRAVEHPDLADEVRWVAAYALGSIAFELQDEQMLQTGITKLVEAVSVGDQPGSPWLIPSYEGTRGLAELAQRGVDLALLEPAVEPVSSWVDGGPVISQNARRFLVLVAIERENQQALEDAVAYFLDGCPPPSPGGGRYLCEQIRGLAERLPDPSLLSPAVPLLAEALDHPRQYTRDNARATLELIGTPEAKTALENR